MLVLAERRILRLLFFELRSNVSLVCPALSCATSGCVLSLVFAHTPTTRQTRAGATGRGFRRGFGRGFVFWNARLPGQVISKVIARRVYFCISAATKTTTPVIPGGSSTSSRALLEPASRLAAARRPGSAAALSRPPRDQT